MLYSYNIDELFRNFCEKFNNVNELVNKTKEYLLFVDADDYLLKGWRDNLAQIMDKQKDVIFFSPDAILSYSKEDIIKNILLKNEQIF